jgi:hypothetical protein
LDTRTDVDYVLGSINPDIKSESESTNATSGSAASGDAALATAKTIASGKAATLGKKPVVDKPETKWDPVPLMKGLEATLGIVGNNSLKAPQKTGFVDPIDLHSPVYGDL